MDHYSGDDIRLLRSVHVGADGRPLRQIDVSAAMEPPRSRQWVAQLENRRRLSPERFRQVAAGIMAASR
jgi:predicted transcriptional regulator